MAEESSEEIAKIIARLPKRIPALFGNGGAEFQAVASQITKQDPEMLFHTKLIAGILQDTKRILTDVKTIISQSIKNIVKTVSEPQKDGGGPGFAKGFIFSQLLKGRIAPLLTAALKGVVARIAGILAALGPVGITLSLALVGAGLAAAGFMKATGKMRDKALEFGETLRGISPAITAIQVQRDLATRFRKMRVGAVIAPEQRALIQSQIRLEDAMEKFVIIGQKINAEIGTIGNDLRTSILQALEVVATYSLKAIEFLPGEQKWAEEMIRLLQGIKDQALDEPGRGVTRQILEGLAGGKWREHEINTDLANADMDRDRGADWGDPVWRRHRRE